MLSPYNQNGGRSFSGFSPHAPRLKRIFARHPLKDTTVEVPKCCGRFVAFWLRAREEFADNRFQLLFIRECGRTLYVGMAQGVLFSLYIGIGAKFYNTQKTGERRLRRAKYKTASL